jgi:flagellar M-ring protein FliF
VRVTTEDVIGAPDGKGAASTGVLVRERESARDSATPDLRNNEARAARGSSMQRDAEYQAGRRVEHLVTQPGAIRRLQVVALVRQELDAARLAEVQRLVGAAVGALPERGDTVVVQTVQAASTKADTPAREPMRAARLAESTPPVPNSHVQAAGGVGVVLLAVLWLARRKLAPVPRRLSQRQREAALQRVQAWLLQSASSSERQAGRVAAGREE